MAQIRALNEGPSPIEDDDDSLDNCLVQCLNLESIAISEYNRAIHLLKGGQTEAANHLFEELLGTELLQQVTRAEKDRTLLIIKYNCHKHLGYWYQSNGNIELALRYLLMALEQDETEIVMLMKLGTLALHMKKLPIAHYAFQTCLKINENHFFAGDGLLQSLCGEESFLEAYGFALHWINKFPYYNRGHYVIMKIRQMFRSTTLNFIESCFTTTYNLKTAPLFSSNSIVLFPEYNNDKPPELIGLPNMEQFKLNELSWSSFANFITTLYDHCRANTDTFAHVIRRNDIYDTAQCHQCSNKTIVAELNANQADIGTGRKIQENVTRATIYCSDVEFQSVTKKVKINIHNTRIVADSENRKRDRLKRRKLEQDRRARKAAKQTEHAGTFGSIEVLFKMALPNIYAVQCDDAMYNDQHDTSVFNLSCVEKDSLILDENTATEFTEFLNDIDIAPFTIISLMFKWLKYISVIWDHKMPMPILDKFQKIYECYLEHTDMHSWHLLNPSDVRAHYSMTIFYLELQMDKLNSTKERNSSITINEWKHLFHFILFTSSFAQELSMDDQERINDIRLKWLQYQLHCLENNRENAIDCLRSIQNDDYDSNNIAVVFPNQIYYNIIKKESINKLITSLTTHVQLARVPELYDKNNYVALIDILIGSLNCYGLKSKRAALPIDTAIQFEILLESLWMNGQYKAVMEWAERYLNYGISEFGCTQKQHTNVRAKWIRCIQFAFAYISELMLDHETTAIVLSLRKYATRLIQNIVKLIALQFQSNNLDANALELYTILHEILLHLELNANETGIFDTKEKVNASDISMNSDRLQSSLEIFALTHRHLLQHTRCMDHNGQILLNAFDLGLKVFRKQAKIGPMNVPLVNYLKQLANCLFGIPYAHYEHPKNDHHLNIDWRRCTEICEIYFAFGFGDTLQSTIVTSDMATVAMWAIDLIASNNSVCDQFGKQRDNILLFIDGTLKIFPEPNFAKTPDVIAVSFYILAMYYLNVTFEYSKARSMFLSDLVHRSANFDSWFGLALANIRKLETQFYGADFLDRAPELKSIDQEINCAFENALKIKPHDYMALKEYGCYAYNFSTNICNELNDEQRANDLLTISQSCFDQLKVSNAGWFVFYMLGNVHESYKKKNLSDAANNFEQSLNELWLSSPDAPAKCNHRERSEKSSLQKFELLYRLIVSTLDYTIFIWNDCDLKLDAYYINCLKKQFKKFGIKLVQKIKSAEIDEFDELFSLCICGLEYCLANNEHHFQSTYRLAWFFFRGPEDFQIIERAGQLLRGVYKNGTNKQIIGLFSNQSPMKLFSNFIQSPCPDINSSGNFSQDIAKCVDLLLDYLDSIKDHASLLQVTVDLAEETKSDKSHFLGHTQSKQLNEKSLMLTIKTVDSYLNALPTDNDAPPNTSADEVLQLLYGIYELYTKFREHSIEIEEKKISSVITKAYCLHMGVQSSAELKITDNIAYRRAIELCQSNPVANKASVASKLSNIAENHLRNGVNQINKNRKRTNLLKSRLTGDMKKTNRKRKSTDYKNHLLLPEGLSDEIKRQYLNNSIKMKEVNNN